MRNLATALLFILPSAAMAQTPADIARQVWPFGAPASAATAPANGSVEAGAATGRDLAKLLWPLAAPTPTGVATARGATYAQSFTPPDLARLRGDAPFEQMIIQDTGPTRMALAGHSPH